MHSTVCRGNNCGLKAVLLISVGFIVGVLLNQYGFVFENIHVDVTITVVDDDLTGSQLPDYLKQLNDNTTRFVVPNIVHFVWFTDDDSGKRLVTFVEYMSILSVYRVQRPDQIQFHCSRLPGVEDYWWTRLWREIPLKIVHHDKSSLIKHLKLDKSRNQLCKLLAIKVLLDQGGIFIDWNVLVVKNLDPFRQFNFTLGKEPSSTLSTDVVAACPNAPFLRILVDSNTVNVEACDVDKTAYKLSLKHPNLLNTVSFDEFAAQEPASDASHHFSVNSTLPYVVRLSESDNVARGQLSPETIKSEAGIIGDVMRLIYYGSK